MRGRFAMVLMLLVLGACGGAVASGETTETTSASTPSSTTTAAPPPTTIAPDHTSEGTAVPGTNDVTIRLVGSSFGEPLTVPVGTRVTVRNADFTDHTWTSADDLWDSKSLQRTEAYSYVFDTPGTFVFFCEFHTAMVGSITVEG